MAVSRRRSVESVDYLGNSYEETDNKHSELDTTVESLDTLDLNSSVGSSNVEETKSARVVDYEREEGDGQEYESDEGRTVTSGSSSVDGGDDDREAPKSERKLDDDEDRRNPQYIPKRGTFYEHDDRTADDDGTGANDTEKEAERAKEQLEKKKVWKEHENRWAHDKYNDDEQKPKSREELIELYGYDIRSEEGPPRARRRRRYGRGPNKYTRNWEDEDAYNKPSPVSGQGRGGGGGGRRGGGGPRGAEEGSEEDLQQRRSEAPTMYYSNKVSGRRGDDRRDNREAFPALPASEAAYRNNRPRSPRDDRPNNNNNAAPPPTNPAWKKESPSPQSRLMRDEYKPNNNNNNTGPLQLTPPPVRREIADVGARRRAEDAAATRGIDNHSPDFEPVKKGAGRGIMGAGRRGKPTDNTSPPSASRGPGGIVQRGIYRGRVNPGRGAPDNRESRSEPPADKAGAYQQVQGPKLRTQDDLVRDLARMTVYNQNQGPDAQQQVATREFTRRPQPEANKGGGNYQRQAVVPPRLQQQEAAANRPKRYSSLRQRSLPEPGAPGIPQQQQQPQPPAYSQPPHQYYQGDTNIDRALLRDVLSDSYLDLSHRKVNRSRFIPSRPRFLSPPAAAVMGMTSSRKGNNNVDTVTHYVNGHHSDPNVLTNSYQGYITSPRQGYVQQPVYAEPPQQQLPPQQPPLQMIHPPTTYAAAFPSPPTFIQPVLRRPPSPHYLPPPPPPQAVLNFVQPQTQFNPQPYPPFQGYTTVNPAPPPPPTELYQPQGGITYYSPEEQIMPRAITRRQRSAIPIVPPPDRLPRGRGRVTDPADLPPGPYGDQESPDYGDPATDQYQDYEARDDQSDYEALSEDRTDSKASNELTEPEHEAPDDVSVEAETLHDGSGDRAEEEEKHVEAEATPPHDGSGDRAKSSASEEKYEDAAEVVPSS